MAFLDNSGDIILDAVLTDTGRLRLAQGDGSFKISKFALGDDEINYGLYNKDHASGSAYYDLEVLQTPVLEAFTNNTSNLKTKLVTMSRTNVLYMPILKLNKNKVDSNPQQSKFSLTYSRDNSQTPTFSDGGTYTAGSNVSDDKFYVAVDQDTYKAFTQFRNANGTLGTGDNLIMPAGVIQGFVASGNPNDAATVSPGGGLIRVDHGLDTDEISTGVGIDSDLTENSFIVELDYRLGRLKPSDADSPEGVNFIDDDNIATYYVPQSPNYLNPAGPGPAATNNLEASKITDLEQTNPQVFDGPRGNTFQFRVHASQEIRQSTYLFNQIGFSVDADSAASNSLFGFAVAEDDQLLVGKKIYYIDSTVRVVGANTGYRLDIPIRFVKLAT
jgi:hypothetical protein